LTATGVAGDHFASSVVGAQPQGGVALYRLGADTASKPDAKTSVRGGVEPPAADARRARWDVEYDLMTLARRRHRGLFGAVVR
jgi:hypothetical protein